MKIYKNIAVLMGGNSAERKVSLRSGTAVAKGLRKAGYKVTEIDLIDHNFNISDDIEAVFIALHGEFGEDGQIQKILQDKGIPYTGSGSDSSRISFDKKLSKEIFIKNNLPTPDYEILNKNDTRSLSLPVVIKPTCQGSSIGVHRIMSKYEWDKAVHDSFKYSNEIIVERYIKGREFTVGIVGKEALPVIEIIAPDSWYDYDAKYIKGGSRHVVPAHIDKELSSSCRNMALQLFEVLGCSGFARVDFIISEDNKIYILELNSIPGFTETSLLPEAAEKYGITFPELCDRIIKLIN